MCLLVWARTAIAGAVISGCSQDGHPHVVRILEGCAEEVQGRLVVAAAGVHVPREAHVDHTDATRLPASRAGDLQSSSTQHVGPRVLQFQPARAF
jgi:hypothetical protein